jgi:hypothetical protein
VGRDASTRVRTLTGAARGPRPVRRAPPLQLGSVQDVEFFSDGRWFVSAADTVQRSSTDRGLLVWDYDAVRGPHPYWHLHGCLCPGPCHSMVPPVPQRLSYRAPVTVPVRSCPCACPPVSVRLCLW